MHHAAFADARLTADQQDACKFACLQWCAKGCQHIQFLVASGQFAMIKDLGLRLFVEKQVGPLFFSEAFE